MKANSTFNFTRFYALIFMVAYLSVSLSAQTSHNVSVSGTSFSPENLTITEGDEVVWTNSSGSHNVNGQKTTFPNNPVSFGNNVGSGWTYKFTFNTPGTYNYQCDPHVSFGMTGIIVVDEKNTTAIEAIDSPTALNIQIYPNPANRYVELKISAGHAPINSVKIYSVSGALLDAKNFSGKTESLRYDVSRFRNGLYFMEINSGNKKDVLKFLKQ